MKTHLKGAESKRAEKTVLIVDDDPSNLELISGFLRGHYNILSANSGLEALQRSEECKEDIHILLTDFAMGGMTGLELATQITLTRPSITVLLMSGFTGGMLVLNEGWHFLPKPFIASQLRTLIGCPGVNLTRWCNPSLDGRRRVPMPLW